MRPGQDTGGRLSLSTPLCLLALAATLVLSGCGSLGGSEKPELEIGAPAHWTAAESPATEASPDLEVLKDLEISTAWWHDFGSLDLDRLVELVLDNNPSLRAATANLDSAFAQARIEGAPLSPQLSAGLNGSRRKQNFIGFPIPGSSGNILSTTSSNFGLALNVSWEADLWGRLRAREQAALADAAAAASDLEAARLSLAGQAVKGWLTMIEAGQQVALSERTLESRRASERRVVARYRRGLAPSLDVRLAASQAEGVAAQLAQRRQALGVVQRQLEILAGSYPGGRLEIESKLPVAPPAFSAGVPASLLARRPDLRAAEERATASSARLRSARRALYPSLSLTGSTGTSSGELGDLLDGDLSVWSLAAGLLQPIFQGGRLRAGVDLQAAGLDAAEALWLDTALRAFFEVETALEGERFLDDRVTALAEAARQSRAAEELALDRYSRGLAGFLSVLESQRSAFVSESQLLLARRERLLARVDLILALGGGVDATAEHPEPSSARPEPLQGSGEVREAEAGNSDKDGRSPNQEASTKSVSLRARATNNPKVQHP